MSIVKRIASVSTRWPDQVAFIWNGAEWTYARLRESVDRMVGALGSAGVRPGDRVTISMPNSPNLAISLLACLQGGFVAVPMNVRFKSREAQAVLDLVRPVLHLGSASAGADMSELRPGTLPIDAQVVLPDEEGFGAALQAARSKRSAGAKGGEHGTPALLLPTSGTTGQPKIVVHTAATLGSIAERYDAFGLHERDVMLNGSPMVHAGGLFNLLASLVRSGPMVMLRSCDADLVLDAVETHGCTWMKALPFVFADLAEAQARKARDVRSLRFCVASGDALSGQTRRAFADAFRLPLHSAWASTEAATSLCHSAPEGAGYLVRHGGEALLSQGDSSPASGAAGELLVRGPHVSPGYWADAKGLARHELYWFRTGDVFRTKEDGAMSFVSRKKSLIVRAGSNISPHEVEQVLRDDPDVLDAAVFGVPDVRLGERVAALVELAPEAPVSVADVLRRARARLSDYKVPELARIVPKLPRSANGKVDRASLPAHLYAAATET